MVEHLVWFKLKAGVTDEQKQAMLETLRALQSSVPDILHLACGEDFSGRSRGFEIGLIVRFTSREALDVYATYPTHLAFIEGFRALWDDVMALDFEKDR